MAKQDTRQPAAQHKVSQSRVQDIAHRMEALESKLKTSIQPYENGRSSSLRYREQLLEIGANQTTVYLISAGPSILLSYASFVLNRTHLETLLYTTKSKSSKLCTASARSLVASSNLSCLPNFSLGSAFPLPQLQILKYYMLMILQSF